ERLPEPARKHRDALARLLADRARFETREFLQTLPKLEDAGASSDPPPAATEHAGKRRVGAYALLHLLGRGGMGSVWLAERTDGRIKRRVALKLPHAGLATGTFAERLTRERDILASLSHPNIARLYDADVTPEGQPFLALEYVEGLPLTDYCDA